MATVISAEKVVIDGLFVWKPGFLVGLIIAIPESSSGQISLQPRALGPTFDVAVRKEHIGTFLVSVTRPPLRLQIYIACERPDMSVTPAIGLTVPNGDE